MEYSSKYRGAVLVIVPQHNTRHLDTRGEVPRWNRRLRVELRTPSPGVATAEIDTPEVLLGQQKENLIICVLL